jgi:putative ABC transport system permease protein
MDSFWQDLRFGARMLRKNPGVTILAAVALALGIGANAAIFSVVNAVLLRSLPYQEPERVVRVFEKRVRENTLTNVVSPADFLDWKTQNQVFQFMAAQIVSPVDLLGGGEPESINAGAVTSEFFDALGVMPARGRSFSAQDDQEGQNHVAILSHGLWVRRFGSDPDLVGKTINLSSLPHTVIGILPAGFRYSDTEIQLWVPFVYSPQLKQVRGAHFLNVYARLKPGVTLQQSQAAMETIAANLEKQYPDINRGHSANVVPLREQLVGEIRPALLVLSVAVGLVQLIACGNVANLLLSRGIARQKEIAVRSSLGAGRWRVIRQLLTESMLLSLLAGALGWLIAVWGVEGLRVVVPHGVQVLGLEDFHVDGTVLAYLLALTVLTGIVFGLVPALKSSRTNLNETLKEGVRSGTSGAGHRRLRNALVILEFSLSLILLAGAGLMVRTFLRLQEVQPGFRPENVVAMPISLPRNRYREPQQQAAFMEALENKLRALPGVESVGAISHVPLTGQDSRTGIAIEDAPPNPSEPTRAHHRVVLPGYFETLRIPLIEGRFVTDADTATAPLVLVFNQTAARRYFPNQSAVGKRIRLGGTQEWRTIVGVAGDVRHWGLDANVNPEMYLPEAQAPWGWTSFVIRSTSDLATLAPALREQVRSLDKDLPIGKIATMEDVISVSISPRRFYLVLLSVFAALAVGLAGVGIYSVIGYGVTQRTREFGIRMTLGARPEEILRLVMREGLKLALIGVVGGVLGALAATRVLQHFLGTLAAGRVMGQFLFQVEPTDPITFASVSLLLIMVGMLACYLPARRATRVDPMVALRYE